MPPRLEYPTGVRNKRKTTWKIRRNLDTTSDSSLDPNCNTVFYDTLKEVRKGGTGAIAP